MRGWLVPVRHYFLWQQPLPGARARRHFQRDQGLAPDRWRLLGESSVADDVYCGDRSSGLLCLCGVHGPSGSPHHPASGVLLHDAPLRGPRHLVRRHAAGRPLPSAPRPLQPHVLLLQFWAQLDDFHPALGDLPARSAHDAQRLLGGNGQGGGFDRLGCLRPSQGGHRAPKHDARVRWSLPARFCSHLLFCRRPSQARDGGRDRASWPAAARRWRCGRPTTTAKL
mmetsp:Transcript_14581/g.37758  ORF Transcript_14581/g.37758 Transcript_14581/m.37758 type:complete len:225 (+) Transcript_14581:864-1538(+)